MPELEPVTITCRQCGSGLGEELVSESDRDRVTVALFDQAACEGWQRDVVRGWLCPRCVRELVGLRLPFGDGGA